MKYLWYIAQTLFIGWFTFTYWERHPNSSSTELLLMFGMWVVLCAFLTACLTRLWDWVIRRLRGLKGHSTDASRDSLRLVGPGSRPSKLAEHRKRVRISE
jgi:hypothetical protein